MTHIVRILLAFELHKAIPLVLACDSVLGEVDINCKRHSTVDSVKFTMLRIAVIAGRHAVAKHCLANCAFSAICPSLLRNTSEARALGI